MKNKLKYLNIAAALLAILICSTSTAYSQSFKAEKVSGPVSAQTGTSETWVEVKPGMELSDKSVIVTGENGAVQLSGKNIKFNLKGTSAVNLDKLKKMTLDELLLALAMQNLMDAPKNNNNGKSKSTAVYGTKYGSEKVPLIEADDYGIKKLNGAVQLAEAGYKESAVVQAKETFRKYPETNSITAFRIYFANILFDKGLYDEAYIDFTSIKGLDLNDKEQKEVSAKLETISKKLSVNQK